MADAATATPPKPTRLRRSAWGPTVTVEVDPSDLEDAGWHHEDDCPAGAGLITGKENLHAAIDDLHRQAHNASGDALYALHYRREPCVGIYGHWTTEP